MGFLDAVRSFLDGFDGRSGPLPPNVVRSPSGNAVPAPGYQWMSDRPGDFRVEWVSGKLWPERHLLSGYAPGRWWPAPGYDWDGPNGAARGRVVWVPGKVETPIHIIAGEREGTFRPMQGYSWVQPNVEGCLDVEWTPSLPHRDIANVVAAEREGRWRPASGHRWENGEPRGDRINPGFTAEDVPWNWGGNRTTGLDLGRLRDLATLGLDENASAADVHTAFKRLVKIHHPDLFAGAAEGVQVQANRAFVLLRAAYERLTRGGSRG